MIFIHVIRLVQLYYIIVTLNVKSNNQTNWLLLHIIVHILYWTYCSDVIYLKI